MPQVENAGGHSSGDGKCISSLDVPILVHDQRTQVCFGSKGEVKRFEEYMHGEWRHGAGEWRCRVGGNAPIDVWKKLP